MANTTDLISSAEDKDITSALSVHQDSAINADAGMGWSQASNRVNRYLLALGATPDEADKLAREIVDGIASDPESTPGNHALDKAFRKLLSRIANARSGNEVDADRINEDSVYVRLCVWISGSRPDLQSTCSPTLHDLPIQIDEVGHVHLNSMPSIERLHMVPADLSHNLFHGLLHRPQQQDE